MNIISLLLFRRPGMLLGRGLGVVGKKNGARPSNRPGRRLWGVLISTAFLLPACVTREDIRGIQKDLYTIQSGIETRLGNVKTQTENVQTSQADLLGQIQELSGNLTALRAELQDSQQRMEKLSTRLDDLEASLTARMDSQIELLSGSKFVEKPSPSTVYNLANTDFARGRYNEAIKGFQSFLKQFPKSEKAAEAKLKIGDSFAKLKDSASAIEAYDDLINNHPKDPLTASAMLRKANQYEAAGKKTSAKEVYSAVVKNFPYGDAARAAQERLRELQTGQ